MNIAKIDGALDALRAILEIVPDVVKNHTVLGVLNFSLEFGKVKAIDCLETVISFVKGSNALWVGVSGVLLKPLENS